MQSNFLDFGIFVVVVAAAAAAAAASFHARIKIIDYCVQILYLLQVVLA